MIVDSSALAAVILNEDDAPELARQMLAADRLRMSAASYLETSMVIDGRGIPRLSELVDVLIGQLGIVTVPFTPEQAVLARQAFAQHGRGSGHPAKLNFGDCISYALAKEANETLLYKGDDFGKTTVRRED